MAGFRLLTFVEGGRSRPGVLVDGRVFTPEELLGTPPFPAASTLDILDHWPQASKALGQATNTPPGGGRPLDSVRLTAPILYPRTIYCAGANYWDHMNEMADLIRKNTGSAPPVEKAKDPWFFIKATGSTVIGPGDEIRLPAFSSMVDWEAEIALVIGTPARNVPQERALAHVAGITILNDLSARDFIKREGSPFIYDWIGQKCFDTAAPMGPWITPMSEIADPDDIPIRLWVNDVPKQDSNASQLIHNFAEQVSYLSSRLTLRPGDVVATGTPAGVGMPKGEFLAPGDTVRIEVGGCGELVNRCVAGD